MKKILIVAEVDEEKLREWMEVKNSELSLEDLIMDVVNGSFWDDIQCRYIKTKSVFVTGNESEGII